MKHREIEEAYRRIRLLQDYYRRLAQTQPADGTWDWWLNREIAQLREGVRRMLREEVERCRVESHTAS